MAMAMGVGVGVVAAALTVVMIVIVVVVVSCQSSRGVKGTQSPDLVGENEAGVNVEVQTWQRQRQRLWFDCDQAASRCRQRCSQSRQSKRGSGSHGCAAVCL